MNCHSLRVVIYFLRSLLSVLTENKGGLCSTLIDGSTMIIKTENIQYERLILLA
jgi:hypothetical protein